MIQRSQGSGSIVLCSDQLPTPITLTNVLYIPPCPVNLLSVNAVAHSHHCSITFDKPVVLPRRLPLPYGPFQPPVMVFISLQAGHVSVQNCVLFLLCYIQMDYSVATHL